MKISANTAIQSQLSTLPKMDQEHVATVLSNLDPAAVSDRVKRIPDDQTLLEIRITSRLRALVRVKQEQDQVEILAIARPDQIARYLKLQRAS